MENKRNTKRTLFTSALSLVLCIALLIGTTFAWFTDSVTSAGNKIVAGNLDVKLLMKKGDVYEDISDSQNPIFGGENSKVAQNNATDTLWEPGKTQVVYLGIQNAGSLDLKYNVALDVTNPTDGKNLYKVMQYAITPDAQDGITEWKGGNSVVLGKQAVSGFVALEAGKTHYFALSVHMLETAGNEYKGGQVSFDLNVIATQLASEEDSFDNTYDENAIYYDVLVKNTEELEAALNAGKETIAIDGVISLTKSLVAKNVTLVGIDSEAGITFGANHIDRSGATVITYKNLILDGTRKNSDGTLGGWYNGIDYANGLEANYIDCTIVNGITTYAKTANFTNCTFSEHDEYGVFMYGSKIANLDGCTFYYGDRAIKVYSEGGEPNKTININDCMFVKGNNFNLNKGLVEVDDAYLTTVAVNINGAVVDTNLGDVKIVSVKNATSTKTTVVIDGVTQTTVKPAGTAADLQEALNKLKNGETVLLTQDIDLTGENWDVTAPWQGSNTAVVFDGGNHTIKGLSTTGLQGGLFGKISTNGNVTIKNLTIKDAKLTGTDQVGEGAGGALIGWFESHGGVLTVENVKVTGVNITGFKYVGGLIGYTNTNYAADISDCLVDGTLLNSTYNESGNYKGHIGGLVGYYGKGTVTNTTVSNLTVKRAATEGSNRAGALFGTVAANCAVASATVNNVTVDGVAASLDNVFGPNASATTVSKDNITIK